MKHEYPLPLAHLSSKSVSMNLFGCRSTPRFISASNCEYNNYLCFNKLILKKLYCHFISQAPADASDSREQRLNKDTSRCTWISDLPISKIHVSQLVQEQLWTVRAMITLTEGRKNINKRLIYDNPYRLPYHCKVNKHSSYRTWTMCSVRLRSFSIATRATSGDSAWIGGIRYVYWLAQLDKNVQRQMVPSNTEVPKWAIYWTRAVVLLQTVQNLVKLIDSPCPD